MQKKFILLTCIMFISVLSMINVNATGINLFKHYNIQVKNADGNPMTGTYLFTFEFTNNQDCSGVGYSYDVTKTTDVNGIVSIYVPSSGIDFSTQKYLCYYRDTVLKSVVSNNETIIAPVPYADMCINSSWGGLIGKPTSLSFFIDDLTYSDKNVNYSTSSNYSLHSNSSTNWGNLNSVNTTKMQNNGGILEIIVGAGSWLWNEMNSWFATKTTDNLAQGTTNFYDNRSWNESYANGKYRGLSNNTFTSDVNITSHNITDVNCIIYKSGGMDCSA